MFRKVILGGILGAVVLSLWALFSWHALPWHAMFMNKFKDESVVYQTIQDNVDKNGIYVLPCFDTKENTGDDCPCLDQEENLEERPFIFAMVNLKGVKAFSFMTYLRFFMFHFTGAALMSYILLQISGRYGKRVLSVALTGLIIGVVVYLAGWNWFGSAQGFPFTIIMFADYFVSWTIMGIFLGAYVKPSKKELA